MIDPDSPLLVVTDLDGSLLDHHDYNWEAARPWLDYFAARQIPVVLCSSKTAAEIIPLQKRLGLGGAPFIAENGARISFGDDVTVNDEPDADYLALCDMLAALKTEFRFTGFHDLSDSDVASFTGLALSDARLSRLRDASEVILWRDESDKLEAFRAALARHQLALTQGGRFWHVMPENCGKGIALTQLQQQLMQQDGVSRITLGLGDGPNDIPMLEQADYAVIIKGFSKSPVTLSRTDSDHIYRTAQTGPEGWSEGIEHFLAPHKP